MLKLKIGVLAVLLAGALVGCTTNGGDYSHSSATPHSGGRVAPHWCPVAV